MKNTKPTTNKVHRDFSLPKLVNKIQNNNKLYQFQRLHFPPKDDPNFVRGVGRKHFQSNVSISLQKLINPQFNDAPKKTNNNRIKTKANQQFKLGQLDRYYLQTQINEPPFARQSRARKMDEIIRTKTNTSQKQKHRYQTETNKIPIGPAFNEKLRNNITDKLRNGSLTIETQLPQSLTSRRVAENNYSSVKNRSSPEPVQMRPSINVQDFRKYNPTYISSNF